MIAALVVLPIAAGLALYLVPRSAELTAKWLGVLVAFACFVIAVLGNGQPDESLRWLQRPFTANLHVGLGGLGYWIVLLLALSTCCALVALRIPRQRDFVAQMLLLLGAMSGVFVARDLLVFALFWDLMLIPVFLMLVAWAPRRNTATAWRYLVYNLSGGLALLLATAAYGVVEGSTDVIGLSVGHGATAIGAVWGTWIFAGYAFGFLVKTPVWPFHTWMPDTYADLPPPAVAVVSAVQSKAGLYGFLVVTAPLLPDQMRAATTLMFVLGLVGLVYGALVALVQDDAKRIVAYSSLSHLGLILLAAFSGNPVALAGAAVYIVAHGLFSAGLFIVLGQVEEREETRLLSRLGGLGEIEPKLAGALHIMVLAALGLPGLCGFAGEILILTGLYQAGAVWPTAIALVPIILAAAYMLRLFQHFMHGPPREDIPQRPDLRPVELLALAPLVVAIVLLGVYPGPVANSGVVAGPNAVVSLAIGARR
jgi:NADH-quinone oxidoreductase subunit M